MSDAVLMSDRRRQIHADHHAQRSQRLGQGVYGKVGKPVLLLGDFAVHPLPTYPESRQMRKRSPVGDLRCFYTGVVCSAESPADGDRDPLKAPFLKTVDHLVPLRRDVPGIPHNPKNVGSTLVVASNIVNVTFGLAPLLVKLKVRQWLAAARFDHDDRSIAAGLNLRWLVISMLEDFRIDGRYPWSLNGRRQWWNPDISVPFMARMWDAEHRFLAMDERERAEFVRDFRWQF